MDFRSDMQKKLEDEYVCSLRKDDKLYRFSSDLLFKNIQLAKKANLSSKEIVNIIRYYLFNPNKSQSRKRYYQKFNGPYKRSKITLRKNAVVKNGYDCYNFNCYKIINLKNKDELYKFNRANNIPLLKITSALYKFQSTNKIITHCVKNSPVLRNRIIKVMNEYFGTPASFAFSELEHLANSSRGSWFIPWIIYYGSYDIHNLLHRSMINNDDYVRIPKKIFTKQTEVIRKDIDDLTCLKKQYNKELDKVIVGTTYYKPFEHSIFLNLFKKYKKNAIAGPSGSSSLAYTYIFDISHILENTHENKILLLKMIIADYYEIHHSISEILLEYSADAKFPPYDLSMNDIDYIRNL